MRYTTLSTFNLTITIKSTYAYSRLSKAANYLRGKPDHGLNHASLAGKFTASLNLVYVELL